MINVRLSGQLEQVQKDLARNLLEVERLGDCLVELGARLKQEPWKWTLDWADNSFPENRTQLMEPEMLDALDRHRIAWLLEDIGILRRRETELKRLAVVDVADVA